MLCSPATTGLTRANTPGEWFKLNPFLSADQQSHHLGRDGWAAALLAPAPSMPPAIRRKIEERSRGSIRFFRLVSAGWAVSR